MQNIVIGVCEKFHNDRLRNDKALVHWISDNNKNNNNKNNVGIVLGDLFPGPTKMKRVVFLLQRSVSRAGPETCFQVQQKWNVLCFCYSEVSVEPVQLSRVFSADEADVDYLQSNEFKWVSTDNANSQLNLCVIP